MNMIEINICSLKKETYSSRWKYKPKFVGKKNITN